jgi:hypothetical protein
MVMLLLTISTLAYLRHGNVIAPQKFNWPLTPVFCPPKHALMHFGINPW